MTDDDATASPSSPDPQDGPKPTVRRISRPRPKKSGHLVVEAPSPAKRAPQPPAPAHPVFPEFPASDDSPAVEEARSEPAPPDLGPEGAEPPAESDWPEPESVSAGSPAGPEGQKRKRRRKKGKGSNQGAPQTQPDAEIPTDPGEAPAAVGVPQGPRPVPQPRQKPDPGLLAKFAWKIYLAEVSEEGVVLIGDNDARELSRRCFRLAEIFLDEQARRC